MNIFDEHKTDEKVILNEIIFRVTINEKTSPETKPFGMSFLWQDKPPKEYMLKELDGRWEQIKSQIIKELYGD